MTQRRTRQLVIGIVLAAIAAAVAGIASAASGSDGLPPPGTRPHAGLVVVPPTDN